MFARGDALWVAFRARAGFSASPSLAIATSMPAISSIRLWTSTCRAELASRREIGMTGAVADAIYRLGNDVRDFFCRGDAGCELIKTTISAAAARLVRVRSSRSRSMCSTASGRSRIARAVAALGERSDLSKADDIGKRPRRVGCQLLQSVHDV